jgi:hypothetical protein
MSEQSIPPGLMFRSFLTVASGYVLSQILFSAFAVLLGILFFPEFNDWLQLDQIAQKRMMEENPGDAIPTAMFLSLVVLNAIACWGVGWLVARTAPFARFQHGVFLAVLLFIMFLQIVIADSPAKKRMDVVYMGVLPIAVVLGAKSGCANRGGTASEDGSDN